MPALWLMWFWWMPWAFAGLDVKRIQARATLHIHREGDEDGYGTDR